MAMTRRSTECATPKRSNCPYPGSAGDFGLGLLSCPVRVARLLIPFPSAPAQDAMLTVFHHPFCPHSRYIRLALGEHRIEHRLIEERVWERRQEFLMLNPAATTPVVVVEGFPPVPGAAVITEFLDETHGADLQEHRLMPEAAGPRVEVRRLVAWFNEKFFAEVSGPLAL